MSNSNGSPPRPEQLQYAWPPNLTAYEAKVLMGLTMLELIAMGMGFLLPMALVQNVAGAVLGVMVAGIVLLSLKKLDALGGVSLPLYLGLRLLAWRRQETIELPFILGDSESAVELEDWEGDTLMIIGDE